MLRRPKALPLAVVTSIVAALPLAAHAADPPPIVFEGEAPRSGPDHFFLPFEVPASIEEIEVRHKALDEANILDFGLDDPRGYRGWGGGTEEPSIVSTEAASRAYVPGPIAPGTWRVVVGKAKTKKSPVRYRVEVRLREKATLAPPAERPRPYAHAPARSRERRYFAGDFHVHSRESTDAQPDIATIVTFAKSRGLDFVELSDHNTVTQAALIGPAQDREPSFLLVPGIEYTTYRGHGNAIGGTRWLDHRIGQPGSTIDRAVAALHEQGALFSVNHPVLDLDDLCIGCAWEHALAPSAIDAVEIGTGALEGPGKIFSAKALAFWDAALDRGSRAAPIGGSDDHRGGATSGGFESPIGSPTTLVLADELSVPALLEAIRAGRTVVKLDGPSDPMVELETDLGVVGAQIAARSVELRAHVTSAPEGSEVRFVHNGTPLASEPVGGSETVHRRVVVAPATGADRYRAEVLVGGRPRTVTGHVWLSLDPSGPEHTSPDDGGCTHAPTRARFEGASLAAAMLLMLLVRRTARRPL